MRAAFRIFSRRFARDQRGNVAVIFAICCVPLITMVGYAVDYSRATQVRSKLRPTRPASARSPRLRRLLSPRAR
jgi:Flp pilus assembly protein TadG